MDYLLGVDIGSTSLKAVIYDLHGNVISKSACPTEKYSPYTNHPDWVIWKPDQIWNGIASSIEKAVSEIDNPKAIKAVAVTGMGMDGVPVDHRGDCLYPFISWHDPRTEPQLRWWMENIGIERQFEIGGNTLFRFNTALRLLWMAEHEPQILKKTHKWLLIEDFINYNLCGVYATDFSMASTTLLFDQKSKSWSKTLLEKSGIDEDLLCDPLPSGTLLGNVHKNAAAKTGLAEGTPVVLGGHDYLCSALPVGAFKPDVLLNITGTWEAIVSSKSIPMLTSHVQKTGMSVQSHVAKNMYATSGYCVAAGMLEWYRKEFGFKAQLAAEEKGGQDWDFLMAEALASPLGANGILFLPHMHGAGCPIMDSRSMGAFLGLKGTPTQGDFVRAMIEGVNFQLLHMISSMEDCLEEKVNDLITVGGGTSNQFWMQNKADVFGKSISVPQVDEATALGAAILAGIGVGMYKDEQDALKYVQKPVKTYQPNEENHQKYQTLFKLYKQLYEVLKPINEQIHSLNFTGDRMN